MRKLGTMALVLITVWLAGGQAALAQDPATLVVNYAEATAARVDSDNQIFVYALLADADGYPMPSAQVQSAALTIGAGTALETTVRREAGSRAAMLVLDASGSMTGERADAARTAAIAFANDKAPDDQIGVMFFNDAVMYASAFTLDRVAAVRAVSLAPAERTPGSCLWDALYQAIEQTRRLPLARRAVLLVTDGADQTLPGGPPCSERSLSEVIALARQPRAHVPVYALGIGNDQSLDADALARLSGETGGMLAIGETAGEIEALFAKLVDGMHAEFVVSAEAALTARAYSQVQVRVTLANGASLTAFTSLDVPAPVFVPPTEPPLDLPTPLAGESGATVGVPPTLPPVTANPPTVNIIKAAQEAGELLVELDVQPGDAPVTAVIVLLDEVPLQTLPPDTFNAPVRLPVGEVAAGTHTLTVEAYDTGGQVGRKQEAVILSGAGAQTEVVQAEATPTVGLIAPVVPSPAPSEEASPEITPVTLTPRPTVTPGATASPTEEEAGGATQEDGEEEGEDMSLTGPALMLIGLIVIAGGVMLAALWWWRSRRMAQRTGPTGTLQMEAVQPFRYDAYVEETASAGGEEVTDFYREQDHEAERTQVWLGDVARARLEVLRSPDMEARVNSPYVLETPRVSLGREASNDIAFTGDRFVSSQHVRILYADDQWFLEELGALNKTFINGREVTGKVPLFDGDLVELGPYTRMRFSVEEPESPSSPPLPPLAGGNDDDDELTRIRV